VATFDARVATLLNIAVVRASSRPAPVASSADPGIIVYVRLSTHDIHLISPDGTDDRVLWTAPQPLALWAAQDLAWRPDGRELAFSSEHGIQLSTVGNASSGTQLVPISAYYGAEVV
jgi:hypothetical protein